MIFIELLYNLGILIALSILSGFLSSRWKNQKFLAPAQGILFGSAALIGMLKPFVLAPGLIFDGRSVMISLAGWFFGPVAAVISGLMAIILRIQIGGGGALTGVLVILASAVTGVCFYYKFRRTDNLSLVHLWIFGLIVHIAMLLLMFTLPDGKGIIVLQNITFPVIAAYPVTTILIGKILSELSKRAELKESLRESEQKYRKLFDAMPVGCALHEMLIDQNGKAADYRFINLNPAFEKLTGMDNSAVTGKTLKEVLPVSEHQFVDFYAPVALEGKNIFFEQYSSALNKYFEIFAYSPQPGMFVTMFNDITSRKAAEEIIKNINIELEEKVKERTADLTFANKELESFSYSVSHDLRAPLRAIEGFSTALFEDYYTEIDQTGQDYLQRIRKAANHMSQLIDDFLNLSRISRKELEIVEINLSNMVTEAAINLKKSEQNRDIELVIQPNLQATGDITTLTILINQLLTNAFKFTINKPKAIIKFGQTTINGEDYYYIEDNGAGFDQNYADKLFVPFQRLHSNSEFPGTGIGLAIAQRIIIKHGGKVFAEGKVEQGASFYFKI